MKILKMGKSVNRSELGLKINKEYICELCGGTFSLNGSDLVKIRTSWKELEKTEDVVNRGAGIAILRSVQRLFANLICPLCTHTNELELELWRKVNLKTIER